MDIKHVLVPSKAFVRLLALQGPSPSSFSELRAGGHHSYADFYNFASTTTLALLEGLVLVGWTFYGLFGACEPIHKVATRTVKLWKEFDDMALKAPKDTRAAWLAECKAEIIGKVDKVSTKPSHGRPYVCSSQGPLDQHQLA